jgi:hypothetical protein
MAIITVGIQIPIMIYATAKENSMFERLVWKIRKLANPHRNWDDYEHK